ncbi:NADPH-dependent sulfite reductase flavoprotein alpha-component [Nocardia transvalensis]|uniref:assimilatory sulfite reductase (NADPH) n=1 Tax=Nocardia transvalensis TaxID=37333 RepID=A0A7W9PEA4_9NOCA|nr:bifunctional nitrate reductase/sulfite reductase flavoprotein subunit alpha [Nocardia transvalensis]MBB5914465.1 NADPH-dependent sulfite reductase flavoprotein alpha-component [Nocardia transvalensis]
MSDAAASSPGTTRTACSYCGVGCGIVVETAADDRGTPVIAKVRGDKLHPANAGRLCTKGATHADLMRAPGRMTTAFHRADRSGSPAPIPVDDAVREAADRLRGILDEHGPDAIALYVSGQMSMEAQYLANKLAKGYLRTVHIEANSRLCMASAGTGYKQSLGADGPPGSYDDLDHADLFFVIGANMADCHPILYLRMADRRKAGAKLIVVDPRRTETAKDADLFLQIAPGTDLALLNGLLHLLIENGDIDADFIAEHTEGWESMPEFLADYPPARVAEITGLAEDDIRTAARWIGAADEWMSLWTMGLNQSTHGTWNTNALCNLHLATGAICRRGSGPFSLTGQPNAMGGREMGYMGPGLPGQRSLLSAADRTFVETAWGLAPGTLREESGPGTVEMFRGMAEGRIKACWIVCSNPVATVANRKTVIAGLEAADLVIAQDVYTETATNAYADLLLPATLWAESDATMVSSERTVTLLRRSVDPPGDARPDWLLIAQVATAMGFPGFEFGSSAEVFEEIRRFANPATGYDLSGIDYDMLREGPAQWPCRTPDQRRNPIRYLNDGAEPFTDGSGHRPRLAFATASRRAVFWPRPHMAPDEMPDDDYPFVLNTGRLPHQWHTMTKTGRVAKLNRLNGKPFVEVHPADAARLGLAEGDQVELASRRGRAVLPARISDRVRPGDCFAPFHWNDEHGEYLTVNAVTNDAVDADSLQPEFKACAVALRKVASVPKPAPTTQAGQPALAAHLAPGSNSTPALGRNQAPTPGSNPTPALGGNQAPTPGSNPTPAFSLASGGGHPLAAILGLDTGTPPTLSETERIYLGGYLAALHSLPVQGQPVLPESAPLSAHSRMWVDGLLAGMYSRAEQSGGAPDRPSAEDGPGRPVTVLWASQTGTAEDLAAAAAARLADSGYAPRLVDMDSCELTDLTGDALVITSTFGDGGPPDNGADFWERLHDSATRFTTLRFAVFALGDSSYDDFCGHGRAVDRTLSERGATRLLPRVDSEPDHEELSARWLDDVLEALGGTETAAPEGNSGPGPTGSTMVLARPAAPAPARTQQFTRSTPLTAPLVRNTLLSRPGAGKEVRQFGFDLRGLEAEYEVGDSLGVWPANDDGSVAEWLAATGLDGERGIELDGRELPLAHALRTHYDITKVSRDLLTFVAEHNPSQRLAKLLRRDNRNELERYLWDRQAVDVLRDFPIRADLVEWLGALKKLQPRQYSISSSPLVDPHEVQLTVGVVRYGERGGVCSTFLADRCQDASAPIFLQRAPHFRPPLDPNAPMIMVGPGTGIAPFRGFLHERRALGSGGRNWLFFGDQHAADNFYYRDELEDMFRTGFLTRLDLAFSRDQRERVYVQHRMIEHGAELWAWLADGGHFYVCGDAGRMARDVDDALLTIAQVHGKLDADGALAFKKRLVAEKRYLRDVY